jgi:hypothetical protein
VKELLEKNVADPEEKMNMVVLAQYLSHVDRYMESRELLVMLQSDSMLMTAMRSCSNFVPS